MTFCTAIDINEVLLATNPCGGLLTDSKNINNENRMPDGEAECHCQAIAGSYLHVLVQPAIPAGGEGQLHADEGSTTWHIIIGQHPNRRRAGHAKQVMAHLIIRAHYQPAHATAYYVTWLLMSPNLSSRYVAN